MSNTLGWIIVAFVLYLLGMVAVGAAYAKKNSSAEDYFLGGRSLGGFVAALSAQASDMSGWLLMGLPGAKISDIRTVYSHPQALMQCSDFFDEHKDINQVAVRNTAFSAKKVKDDGDITQAGIASHISADIYGLQVLESRIQNNKNNATRFIIVSAKRVCRRDADRISICFETPHKSGALYHMLAHFIYNGINMLNIQSRPISDKAWEYRFFVDFEGRFTDTAVQNALRGIREEAIALKILGTY